MIQFKYDQLREDARLVDTYKDLVDLTRPYLLKPSFVAMVCGPVSDGPAGNKATNLRKLAEARSALRDLEFFVFDNTMLEDSFQRIARLQGIEGYNPQIVPEYFEPLFAEGLIHRFVFFAYLGTVRRLP